MCIRDRSCGPGCDCDRYTEFWNVVFSQFDSDGKGNYPPMEHPNIDTGMGLERLACIMQGVDNLFLVDTMQSIMKHICRIAGVQYGCLLYTSLPMRARPACAARARKERCHAGGRRRSAKAF